MEILANNGPGLIGLIGLILSGYFIYRNYKAPVAGNYANTVIFALVLLFGFALPILGMMNCSGWNEGSGTVYSCLILDSGFTRAYANFYYGLLLLSAFALLIPFVIYAYLVVGLGNYLSKKDAVGLGNLSVWGVLFQILSVFIPVLIFPVVTFIAAVGGLVKNRTEGGGKKVNTKCLIAIGVSILMAMLHISVINDIVNGVH